MLRILIKPTRYPLGRWHNCGTFFNEHFLKLKEEQKKQRLQLKQDKKDPYKLLNKDNDDSYMLPFVIDW